MCCRVCLLRARSPLHWLCWQLSGLDPHSPGRTVQLVPLALCMTARVLHLLARQTCRASHTAAPSCA